MSEPPTTTMPSQPNEPRKRRWLLPTLVGVGAFLLGLLIGVAGGGGGDAQTTAASSPAATVTVTATAAPAEPAEPPAEETPPPEAPADDALSDEGWTLTNLDVRDDGLGDFSAVGRVTNESGEAAEAALFSLTALDADGDVIATMDASVTNVADGETVTAEFFSVDPYQEGDWTYEFTVTF
jgi:hypothetical protein